MMIELNHVTVAFDGTPVIEDLDLSIRGGEFFTLLGPSGCGKTTLLRAISGFVAPAAGQVRLDGSDITHLPPEERGIGVVFQNYALFPHLSVFENVAFGPRIAGLGRTELRRSVTEAIARIGLAEHADKKPAELSGGQQQRVAIARALILGTRVLLFDEPLSNLDAKLREDMRDEIRDIQQRLGLTALYVTHDQTEALAISDRIAVMHGGRVCQIGTPRELYDRPASEFVCGFVGETSRLPPHEGLSGGQAFARPEHIRIGAAGANEVTFQTVLERVIFQGARQRLILRVGGARIVADVPASASFGPPGGTLQASVDKAAIHVFEDSAT